MPLNNDRHEKSYVICLFVLNGHDSFPEIPGHQMDQEISNIVNDHIRKHFESDGGFVLFNNKEEFITVLPDSDLNSASRIIDGFKRDIHKKGMSVMEEYSQISQGDEVNWSISVRLIERRSNEDIYPIPVSSKFDLITIVNFSCEPRRQ